MFNWFKKWGTGNDAFFNAGMEGHMEHYMATGTGRVTKHVDPKTGEKSVLYWNYQHMWKYDYNAWNKMWWEKNNPNWQPDLGPRGPKTPPPDNDRPDEGSPQGPGDPTSPILPDTAMALGAGGGGGQMGKLNTPVVSQTAAFYDSTTQWVTAANQILDPTYGDVDSEHTNLADFLARPVITGVFNWTLSATVGQTIFSFNPWVEFLSNTQVSGKISNFFALRGTMHVKFTINGTAFHFGRAYCHYNPYHLTDNTLQTGSVSIPNQRFLLTQRPGCYLDPTESAGGEVICPFFHFENGLNLTDASVQQMGLMQVTIITPLALANGGTEPASIVVSCWMDNVELCVATASAPILTLPTNNEETTPPEIVVAEGAISEVSSTIASVAGALKVIPIMAPFATATEMGMTAFSKIAGIFGFCREIAPTVIMRNKPTYLSNLASTEDPDGCLKLAVDNQQELCLDSRTVGLHGIDELTIMSIAGREALIDNFDWNSTQIPNVVLRQYRVTPVYRTATSTSTGFNILPSPVYFAAAPFQFWRGTLIFRIVIVASAMHKGRLRVTWDPATGNDNNASFMNTKINRIVDLSQQRDFEIPIRWNQTAPYKAVTPPNFGEAFFNPTIAPNPLYDNGVLTIQVYNTLTNISDAATRSPMVLAYIRAGEDFEVAGPTVSNIRDYKAFSNDLPAPSPPLRSTAESNPIFVPTDTVAAEGETLDSAMQEEHSPMEGNIPRPMASYAEGDAEMGQPVGASDSPLLEVGNINEMPQKNRVFFGEVIASFRSLIKRYNIYRHEPIADLPADTTIAYGIAGSWFPADGGGSLTGFNGPFLDFDANGFGYNFCGFTLLNYLAPAFAGMRGSIRYKVKLDNTSGNDMGITQVTRVPNMSYSSRGVGFAMTDSQNQYYYGAISNIVPTHAGALATDMRNNPTLEFELPWYSPSRFTAARNIQAYRADISTGNLPGYVVQGVATNRTNDPSWVTMTTYVAAGDDFDLFWFINTPIFLVGQDPTAAYKPFNTQTPT